VDAPTIEPPSPDRATPDAPLTATWLGRIDYREAHALQKRLVDQRASGEIGDRLLLLEHPAVLTLGRNSDPAHIRATPAELGSRAIEVVEIERGGEVTYHGPGQLVAYPIVRLHERGLLLRPFVRALGLRVERGVSYHGIALNVSVDLSDFELIDPCGMPDVVSTSIAHERGDDDMLPTTSSVEGAAWIFADAFATAIGAPLDIAAA
jgi:lipoyl(octanoyl) transferase